jgi:hypothetical protein
MVCCKSFHNFYEQMEEEFVDKGDTYLILISMHPFVWAKMTYCPFCGSKLKVIE